MNEFFGGAVFVGKPNFFSSRKCTSADEGENTLFSLFRLDSELLGSSRSFVLFVDARATAKVKINACKQVWISFVIMQPADAMDTILLPIAATTLLPAAKTLYTISAQEGTHKHLFIQANSSRGSWVRWAPFVALRLVARLRPDALLSNPHVQRTRQGVAHAGRWKRAIDL